LQWLTLFFLANKVVFCTGGAGTICSAQVRALVHLGANACIIGRNVEKTERAAQDIATARPGAKVIGIGAVDVRQFEDLKNAVERCVKELGSIDYVMYACLQGIGASRFVSFVLIVVPVPVLRAISSPLLSSSQLMLSSP
jgi:NAD(P)-dependent dehydrogenase (short-subunit alcohol dehydrogenase family)